MQQETYFLYSLLLFVFSGMHVTIHGGLEIRLSKDALNGFYISLSIISIVPIVCLKTCAVAP